MSLFGRRPADRLLKKSSALRQYVENLEAETYKNAAEWRAKTIELSTMDFAAAKGEVIEALKIPSLAHNAIQVFKKIVENGIANYEYSQVNGLFRTAIESVTWGDHEALCDFLLDEYIKINRAYFKSNDGTKIDAAIGSVGNLPFASNKYDELKSFGLTMALWLDDNSHPEYAERLLYSMAKTSDDVMIADRWGQLIDSLHPEFAMARVALAFTNSDSSSSLRLVAAAKMGQGFGRKPQDAAPGVVVTV